MVDSSAWMPLHAALRIKHFIWAYYCFMDSPHWTPEINANLILSIYDHCDYVRKHLNRVDHNHTIMEMECLLYGSLFFPEFDKSGAWSEIAARTLEDCALHQIYADGVHIEAIPDYHTRCIFWLGAPMVFAQVIKKPLSNSYKDLLEKMFEFAKHCYRPNGQCVPFGDGEADNEYPRQFIWSFGYYYFGLKDMSLYAKPTEALAWYIGTEKMKKTVESKSPGEASKAFKNGGYYCIKSGWDKDAHSVLLRCGPFVFGHPHADLLSIDLSAYGKPLLVDAGKYTYNECTDRRYVKGTASHNTIVIDGMDQAEYIHRMSFRQVPTYDINKWTAGENYVFVDAEHYGYHRTGGKATHRRQLAFINSEFYVVIDRITGSGNHDIEQYWHLHSNNARMDAKSFAVESMDEDQPNISIIPYIPYTVRAELNEGWYSEKYGIKKKGKVIRYWMKERLPVSIGTILYPQKAGERKEISISSFNIDDNVAAVNVVIDGRSYKIRIDGSVSFEA